MHAIYSVLVPDRQPAGLQPHMYSADVEQHTAALPLHNHMHAGLTLLKGLHRRQWPLRPCQHNSCQRRGNTQRPLPLAAAGCNCCHSCPALPCQAVVVVASPNTLPAMPSNVRTRCAAFDASTCSSAQAGCRPQQRPCAACCHCLHKASRIQLPCLHTAHKRLYGVRQPARPA